jgi:hypothetical protein
VRVLRPRGGGLAGVELVARRGRRSGASLRLGRDAGVSSVSYWRAGRNRIGATVHLTTGDGVRAYV